MVTIYNHTLIITMLNTDAVQDSQGNWTQQDSETTLLLPCRAEPNGNRYLVLPDGTKYVFAFVVYMPLSTPEIPEGAAVTIKNISQSAAGYAPLSKDPIEITITADMAGDNTVAVASLKGKSFRLERRGTGTYKRSEYSYLPGGGFVLDDSIYPPQPDELFFAYVTGNNVSADIDSARLMASGTVKEFIRNQFNCRLWL